MRFDLSVIFNKGALETLGKAYGWTLFIAVGALLIGTVLGTLIAICKVIPKNNLFAKVLDKIASLYVALFRGTPLTVQLFIFYFIIFAGVTLFSASVTPYIIAVVGFGLNSAAYVSEIIRSGILSVDKGQMEAGRALGLSYRKSPARQRSDHVGERHVGRAGNRRCRILYRDQKHRQQHLQRNHPVYLRGGSLLRHGAHNERVPVQTREKA